MNFIILFLHINIFVHNSYAQGATQLAVWEGDHVQRCFEFKDKKWISVEKFGQGKYKWHVFFDRKNYGQLETKGPTQDLGKHSAFETIVKKTGNFPVRKKDPQFSKFINNQEERPVLIADVPLSDPDQWTIGHVKKSVELKAKKMLIKEIFNDIVFNEKTSGKPLRSKRVPKVEDVVLGKTYQNKFGAVAFKLQFAPKGPEEAFGVQNDEPHWEQFDPRWYLAQGDNITFIGLGIALVEAADVDGDGKSELFIFQSGYNLDAYSLFFPETKQTITNYWSYH